MNIDDARSLFERSYAAWSRPDLDALISLYTADCEWDNTRIPVDPKLYRGHEGLRDAFAAWFENWSEFRVEIAELSQLDDELFLIVGRGSGVGRASGVPVELVTIAQLVSVRDGRIARVANYVDPAEALAHADP